MIDILKDKKLLILDMNSTFMFGEDRFSEDENYYIYYKKIGGVLGKEFVNTLINRAYKYLEDRYTDEKYFECFPSLEEAIINTLDKSISNKEIENLIETFAYHERGDISSSYVELLKRLDENFSLALIADIWAPSKIWRELFDDLDITRLFNSIIFSSDIKVIKPSSKPFFKTLEKLKFDASASLMIGDSIRRDLGGAKNAGIDCIFIGNEDHKDAIYSCKTLHDLMK